MQQTLDDVMLSRLAPARISRRDAEPAARLGARESDFVRSSPDRVQAALCAALALALNRLDASPLAGRIAPRAVFEAGPQRPRMVGAEAVLGWLGGRFDAMRLLGVSRLSRAELARAPGGRPCVLLHRRSGGHAARGLGERTAGFHLQADEQGRIARLLSMDDASSLRALRGTGLFPGVAPGQLRRERQYAPPRLRRDAGFLFKVFELPEDEFGNRVVEDSVAACLGHLPGSACRIFPVKPSAPGPRDLGQDLERYRIGSFPAVVVEHRGELVARLVGAWGPRQFRRVLADRIEL